MQLKVQQMQGETWKDLVEIPDKSRVDTRGNHISRGTICRMKANGRARYVVVVGLKEETGVIGMDLNIRQAFQVKCGEVFEVELRPVSWMGRLLFGWSASDPAYRIPSQLAIIALFLGTFLGVVGVILGGIPIYEELHGPIFKHHSSESSTAPNHDSQMAAADHRQ